MGQLAKFIANPLVLILVITAGGLALAGRFWSSYRDALVGDPRFQLRADGIQMNEPPAWLSSAAHRQWLESLGWEGQSLLQPSLVADVAGQLQRDPWVEEVLRVRKTPVGLQIEVRYGQPLLVELPGGKILPINPRGCVLDGRDLSLESTESFLRIAVRDLVGTPLKIGEPWPDDRVVLAAELGRHLARSGESTRIAGIYAHDWPVVAGAAAPGRASERVIEFRLWTRGRNEIIWGSPIGRESATEAGWEQKLRGLVDFVRRHGAIDQWSGLPAGQGNVLDLRSGELVLLRNAKLAFESPPEYR